MKLVKQNILKLTRSKPLYILVLILFYFTNGYCQNESWEKQIHVVFRFDDYSARSNTELELKIIEAFQKNNMAFTIGVIPFIGTGNLMDPTDRGYIPLGEEKGNILKNAYDLGIVEVGLHGYSHQSHSLEFKGSEFQGLEYSQQLEKIKLGKAYLEEISGAKINTFIPPWNKYDDNTLKIQEELNIANISADGFGTMNSTSSIKLLPNSCGLTDIKEAVEDARKSSDKSSIIVALFHSYDFIEENEKDGLLNFSDFSSLISWVSQQSDLKIQTIDQLISELPENYLRNKYELNQKIIKCANKTPPYIRGKHNYRYGSKSFLNKLCLKTILFYTGIFIITFGIFLVLLNKLKSLVRRRKMILTTFSLFLFALILGYVFSNPSFGYNVAIALTFAIAFSISMLWRLYAVRKKV